MSYAPPYYHPYYHPAYRTPGRKKHNVLFIVLGSTLGSLLLLLTVITSTITGNAKFQCGISSGSPHNPVWYPVVTITGPTQMGGVRRVNLVFYNQAGTPIGNANPLISLFGHAVPEGQTESVPLDGWEYNWDYSANSWHGTDASSGPDNPVPASCSVTGHS